MTGKTVYHYSGTDIEVPHPDLSTFEKINQALVEGQAAIQELALLKPTLALAISKLEKKQLKVGPHSELGEWALQAKQEQDGVAVVFRAVKA